MAFSTLINYFRKLLEFFRGYFQTFISWNNHRKVFLEKSSCKNLIRKREKSGKLIMRKISIKYILKEYIRSHFLHESIFFLGSYMSVSKPLICFWKQVISINWRNKLLIRNMNLTDHRKSACFLLLLVFLKICDALRDLVLFVQF